MSLASMDEALTTTRQVMSSEFDFNPTAVLETTDFSAALAGEGVEGVSSTCSRVWCGF